MTGPRTPRTWVLAVLILLLVSINGLLLVANRHTDASARAQKQAVALVKEELPRLMSYRADDLGDYRDRVLALASGSFRTQMTNLISPAFLKDAQTRQVTMKTSVESVGTVSRDPSRVELLVYVNQWRTTTATKSPAFESVRLDLVVVRVGDSWRITRLAPL